MTTIKQAVDYMEKFKKSDVANFEKKYSPSEDDRLELARLARVTAPLMDVLAILDPVSAYASVMSMGVTLGQLTRDLDKGEALVPESTEKVNKDLAFSLSPANKGLLRSWLRDNLSSDLTRDKQDLILDIFKQLQEQEKVGA